MAAFQSNLLVRSHKWAVRQDENFLTECFAHLLEYLLQNESEAAAALVSRLTGGIIAILPSQTRLLEVQTQVNSEDGVSDIELRTDDHFVIIEVKNEGAATEVQLRRYRRLLEKSHAISKGLILLTRIPESVEGADHYLRWYRVAEWLEVEVGKYKFKPTSQYLVDQFLGFLTVRNMRMSQVTWEMTTGVRSLRTFLDMLYEAASACGLRRFKEGSHNYMAISIDGGLYWAGIEYENPEYLVFSTDKANVDTEAASDLGVGTAVFEKEKTRFGWRRDLNLESEDIHFFARSTASQMQFLEQFLRENYHLAKKITLKEPPQNPSSSNSAATEI